MRGIFRTRHDDNINDNRFLSNDWIHWMCISTSGKFMAIPELSKMITLSSEMITRVRGPIRIDFLSNVTTREEIF